MELMEKNEMRKLAGADPLNEHEEKFYRRFGQYPSVLEGSKLHDVSKGFKGRKPGKLIILEGDTYKEEAEEIEKWLKDITS